MSAPHTRDGATASRVRRADQHNDPGARERRGRVHRNNV